ncbi:MAG: lyase family protein [Bacteroidetes bacterium]|nr:lyase family protein [Bacteroidota bacterium]
MAKFREIKPNTNKNKTTKTGNTNIYYGEKTINSLTSYNIGEEFMPNSVIKAIGILKKAVMLANEELKILTKDKSIRIIKAIDELLEGELDNQFPLKVWQIGSGMHTNMNVNEVIANRAIFLSGGNSSSTIIDPVNDINKSQSSNDAFSIAMHIAAALTMKNNLIPAAKKLQNSLEKKAEEFKNIVKVGRTHSMDSFLLTFGEEFTAYVHQINNDIERMEFALNGIYDLPIGTMVIGTDRIAIHKDIPIKVLKQLQKLTKIPFRIAPNKLSMLSSKDKLVFAHSTMRIFSATLFKIANDMRVLASGPRCGIGELILPIADTNDPSMPGKYNPIPSEIVAMITAQVFGNDATIQFSAANTDLELNVYMPVIIFNFLQSANLLSDTCSMFDKKCIRGVEINRNRNTEHLYNTLVTIKELDPHIGRVNADNIAKLAIKENISIKDAAIKLKLVKEDKFDIITHPEKYINKK